MSFVEPVLGVWWRRLPASALFLVKRAPKTQEGVYNHLAPIAHVSHPRAVKSEEEADAEAK